MHVDRVVGHVGRNLSSNGIKWAHGHSCWKLKTSGQKNFVKKKKNMAYLGLAASQPLGIDDR